MYIIKYITINIYLSVARAREGPRRYSSDSICVTVLNLEPKSPNPANRFEKNRFLKEVPNMDCFARYRVAT